MSEWMNDGDSVPSEEILIRFVWDQRASQDEGFAMQKPGKSRENHVKVATRPEHY